MTIDEKGEILAAIAALADRLATETADLRRELAAGLALQEISISDLKAGQESLKAGVESSISALKKDFGALRSELLAVRVDLMARMDRLQDHMSGLATI